MAYDATHPAPRPAMTPLFDNCHVGDNPRVRWPDQPGQKWTPDAQLATTIREVDVHWSEERTPQGLPLMAYLRRIGAIAYYHTYLRNWGRAGGPKIPGFGIMYHYAVTPPDEGGVAHILHLQPETLRTWHAQDANDRAIGVVVLAGHGDPIYPATRTSLEALLDWFTTGRTDLPLVTARPRQVLHLGRRYRTFGVLTHDESLGQQGHTTKGCCGVYKDVVQRWRDRQPAG